MKIKYLSFTIVAFFCQLMHAQTVAPAIQWQKSLGGSADEEAYDIKQTSDGGYIATGYSSSNNGDVTGNHGGYDMWVVKLNNTGTIQWQKSLGGTEDDQGYSIKQTADGGYIVSGESASNNGDVTGNHGETDAWVVKLNSTGNIQWQKSLGGSDFDAGLVSLTNDGGYIVVGYTASNDGDIAGNHGGDDVWVVKLNSTGSIQWQKALGGSVDEEASHIEQTADGGYILTGTSTSDDGDIAENKGEGDVLVVKLGTAGAIQWQKTFGGSGDDLGYAVKQTTDGGYIVSGYSFSNDGDVTGHHGTLNTSDEWIIKLNSTGVIQWQKSLGGSDLDFATSIQQTTDGGYIVGGFSGSSDGDVTGNHGDADMLAIKLTGTGNIMWQKSMGGSDYDAALLGIQQTTDGGYIFSGSSNSNNGDVTGHHGTNDNSDFWIVKLGIAPTVTTLTFNGNGNWSNAANWSNNQVPTSPVQAGTQIVINPQAGGECVLNVSVTIANGSSLSVAPGARFRIGGNLTITQ